jgi:uncharacterized protein (UPF0248 family)
VVQDPSREQARDVDRTVRQGEEAMSESKRILFKVIKRLQFWNFGRPVPLHRILKAWYKEMMKKYA